MNLLPGDTAQLLLGANATPAEIHQLSVELHLNEPFWVRYGNWLGGVFHGSRGTSLQNGENVTTILGARLPVTAELLLYAFVMSIVLAVGLAVLAARRPNGIMDRISLMISMMGLSVAPYVLALVLIYLFAVRLQWFPAIGYTPLSANPVQNIRSLTLPAISIGLPLFGLITLVALNLGTLIGAAAIIEPIFSLPGVGDILVQSINDHDVPVVEGIVVVFAVVVVVANLLADILYAALDPRIRYGRAAT
jgi:peptide/nickel transport system permease protein